MMRFIFLGLVLMGQFSLAQTCGGYSMVNAANTQLVAPTPPAYETCERRTTDQDGNQVVTIDQLCQARNQEKERTFSFQTSCFNQATQMQQQVQQAAATAEQQRLATLAQQTSVKAAAETAEAKNKEGSQIYQLAAIGCGGAAAYYGMAFGASCSGGATCQMGLLYKSLAFAALAVLASQQASSHDQVAHSACETAGKVSSAGSDCGAQPTPYNPATFPATTGPGGTGTGPGPGTGTIGSIFDPNGKCIGSAAQCQAIIKSLPPGTNIKEGIKSINSFASSGNRPFKVDKDGNLITKDGKKYNAKDFASEQAMVAAGISAADAKSIMGDLNKATGGFDAKAALAKENAKKDDGSLFGDGAAGGAGGGKGGALGANGSAGAGKDIGGGKRDPASAEGLAKEFNGDMIGVAGDDIFKMMNRRYKLKTSQDNFIAP